MSQFRKGTQIRYVTGISDMVVDTYLRAEPQSRVACETLTTTNKVVLAR